MMTPHPDDDPELVRRLQDLRAVLTLEGCTCVPHTQVSPDAYRVAHKPGCAVADAFYPVDEHTGGLPDGA